MKNKKAYRMITTVIAIVIVVVGMFLWIQKQNSGLENSTIFSEEVVEAEMKNVIEILDKEDYDSLQAISDDTMKKSLTPEVWGEAKQQFSENWGALEKLGTIYLSEVEQDGVVLAAGQVKATYENVKVTYTIVFNQEMQLAGLYIK